MNTLYQFILFSNTNDEATISIDLYRNAFLNRVYIHRRPNQPINDILREYYIIR